MNPSVSKPEKIQACEWMSKNKHGDITTCSALPTKFAPRCGKWYCLAFHYKLAKNFKNFKPFEK